MTVCMHEGTLFPHMRQGKVRKCRTDQGASAMDGRPVGTVTVTRGKRGSVPLSAYSDKEHKAMCSSETGSAGRTCPARMARPPSGSRLLPPAGDDRRPEADRACARCA